jgi:hypothetical protein
MGTEVLDNVESVNIAKFIPELANEPRDPFFDPYLAEIEDFSRVSKSPPFQHLPKSKHRDPLK